MARSVNREVKILLLEDVAEDAARNENELRRAGIAFSSKRVCTREDFVKELNDLPPDLILADYRLSSLDGMDALNIAREMHPDVPFIFVSSAFAEDLAIETLLHGATDYVLKDRLSRLVPSVVRALREAEDRTERGKAEAAVRDSESKFRSLFDLAPQIILLADEASGGILDVNRRFCRLTHSPREEVMGRTLEEAGIHLTEGKESFFRTLEASGEVQGADAEIRAQDDSIHDMLLFARRIRLGGRGCLLCVFSDITDRKRLEAQLQQSQKMEAVGKLAGGIAHDFNNIMTVVMGHSEFLLSSLDEHDPIREAIQPIALAAERASQLTRQLLAFSRQQILESRVMDLNVLVENIKKMLLRVIGEDIELSTVLDPDLWRVRADPSQIEQVLINLAVNARDAMPEGGKLTIETMNAEFDEAYTNQHVDVRPGRHVLIVVGDTGIGMDEETRARAFDPFFTTKEKGTGTGLGLSTVYGIVKQSGGHIWVESERSRGATFRLCLPSVEEETEAADLKPSLPAYAKGSETVLLVEDDAGVRDLIRVILQRNGYRVLEAANAGDAILTSEQHTGFIHLLLTDVVLPKMSGPDLAERLEPFHPEMKALYMSGHVDKPVVQRGILEAGRFFVEKPFHPKDLLKRVREALEAPKQEFS